MPTILVSIRNSSFVIPYAFHYTFVIGITEKLPQFFAVPLHQKSEDSPKIKQIKKGICIRTARTSPSSTTVLTA